MGRGAPVARMTLADYLVFEAQAAVRHEHLDGAIYATAGGSPEHGALAVAVASELRAALSGRPCRVFSSDVRVRVVATGLSTYPDVSVVCGALETAPDDPHAVTNPTVLVEVLSDATEGYDRGAKASHYRRIASLRALVFVSQAERRIEVQLRTDDGSWQLHEHGPGEHLALPGVPAAIAVDAVYANPLAS